MIFYEKLPCYIKDKLGEDYMIGHSYFMNVKRDNLDFITKYKIKPLLEEYFYADDKSVEDIFKEASTPKD